MKLRKSDEWIINLKHLGRFMIDFLESQKIGTHLTCTIDETDDKDIVTHFNQVFIILETTLWATSISYDKIKIERLIKQYARRRAYNTKLDGALSDDYKAFIKQTYENRYKKLMPKDASCSITRMKESAGTGIIKGHTEMTEKQKKGLYIGLEDMAGTRSASKANRIWC